MTRVVCRITAPVAPFTEIQSAMLPAGRPISARPALGMPADPGQALRPCLFPHWAGLRRCHKRGNDVETRWMIRRVVAPGRKPPGGVACPANVAVQASARGAWR